MEVLNTSRRPASLTWLERMVKLLDPTKGKILFELFTVICILLVLWFNEKCIYRKRTDDDAGPSKADDAGPSKGNKKKASKKKTTSKKKKTPLKKKQKKDAASPLAKVVRSLMDMFCGGH